MLIITRPDWQLIVHALFPESPSILFILYLSYQEGLGADYMRRAGPISRAGSVCRDLDTSVKHA